jgi:hypothetical protein
MRNQINEFAEKGLVEDLRSTAQKIAELTSRSMAHDRLPESTVELFDRLVQRAESALVRIQAFRRDH